MHKPVLARTLAHVLALAAVMGAPSVMAASPRPGVTPDPFDQNDASVTGPYRKAIKYGVAEYDAHHFEEALGYFRRAHQLYPNARTLRGIGMASFELRDYVTAARSLTAALDDARKPLSPELRKETQELIDRCQNFVAVYRLKAMPADAQITVDNEAPALEPDGSLMLGLGAHVVEGRAKGHATRTLSLHVRGGERQELLVTLEPAVASAATAPATAAPRADAIVSAPVRHPPVDNHGAKVWLWTGGTLAALSIGSGIYWGNQSLALSSCRSPQKEYRCDNEATLKLERNLGAAATIVTGVTALTAITIGVLSWKSAPARPAKNASLACVPSPFGVACGGSF